MPVVIREIVTEVVLSPEADPTGGTTSAGGPGLSADEVDRVVRLSSERVLEILRREWDR